MFVSLMVVVSDNVPPGKVATPSVWDPNHRSPVINDQLWPDNVAPAPAAMGVTVG